MDDANVWGKSRTITLAGVLASHLGIIALLVAGSRSVSIDVPAEHSIEVMLMPPLKAPRVRVENPRRPERISTNIAIALAPAALNSSAQSGPSSSPDGHGSAVNWSAEAHRALRAFEIRRDQPPSSARSVSNSLEDWWLGEHHAGDQIKTASGDWIVWLDANCYQIASWHSNAMNTSPARTICSPQRRPPREE